jgi:hypothetical protein
MKPVKIFLRRRDGRRRKTKEGANLRCIVSTYVNITMYPPV